MDPLNNPIPNPTPTPTPTPGPVPPVEPVVPPVEPGPVTPVMPPAEPVEPVAPVVPAEPVAPVTPPAPQVTPTPVNPVISPSGVPPVNPVFRPDVSGIAATDPIMTAEPPKAPDPIEEELNAPMKAAEPVPGSIGSAISGPATGNVPNVAFNDPAMESVPAMGGVPTSIPNKKPQSKKTLLILIAIAAVVVVALVIILIMQLMSSSSSSNTPTNNSSSNSQNNSNVTPEPVVHAGTLSCTRNMTESEIVLINDAVSGTVNISAEFEDDALSQISLVKSVIYQDENSASNEPVETEVHEAAAKDLTLDSANIYYLPTSQNGVIDDLESIQENYESLDFTCDLL